MQSNYGGAKPNFSGGYQAPGTNMGGPGNPGGVNNTPYPEQSDRVNYYWRQRPQFSGQPMGGQSPYAGRYRPPMMRSPASNDWYDQGGYDYNLPNSYGPATQFGEFNSPDYPGYGGGRPRFNPFFDGLPPGGYRGGGGRGMYGPGSMFPSIDDGGGQPSGRAGWSAPAVHDPNAYARPRLKPMRLDGPDPAAGVPEAEPQPFTSQEAFDRARFSNSIQRPMFSGRYRNQARF